MRDRAWHRRPAAVLARDRDRLLAEWIAREVRPFCPWWAERLGDGKVTGAADLEMAVATNEEADVAGAGGPGNPALLIAADEVAFKRHASRRDLSQAAAEVGGHGVEGRRAAMLRRFKPVHVHEAGVDRVLAIAYTRTDLDRLHVAGRRLAEVLGLDSDDALVNAVPAGPTLAFWGLYHLALATRMTALHPRSPGLPAAAAVARALAMLPASVLAVPVGEAAALLDELAHRTAAVTSLRRVLVVGPPPEAAERRAIAMAGQVLAGHPVRVQAVWAPACSRVLYGEAPSAPDDPPEATYGLLTYPDLEHLEVRDPVTGEPVREGAGGELVVTSLGWRGTALLRVATGSWVAGLESRTPHPVSGSTVPRLAPHARDGAWQPEVTDGATRRRVDLRRAYAVMAGPRTSRLRVQAWSLKALDGELVLGLDCGVQDTAALRALAYALGDAVGVVPEVRLGTRTAYLEPRIGTAGLETVPPAASRAPTSAASIGASKKTP